ncbi:MAG TPA: DUF1194 domain-containing protein [Geminicoccus sp.]|jgi:hypothetical protein|uniref:DUF1194 domain-containing protein n=1 Tax=Geminicoccus sp. TaxID=2024832 RepID=UPI002E3594E7|nr:DUF1194 domain-containing protein [Geminicoccus sp.]HEX2527967.1 DUF1194 domain-containing protein [Geminicoccus sp.]
MIGARLAGIVGLVFTAAAATPASADEVDLELVLAADGSGSIDDGEMRLQRDGYAGALTDPEIVSAMTSGAHGKVAVMYFEWGGADSQVVIADWTVIDGPDSAARFAERLLTAPRGAIGWNSISNAIAFGQKAIAENAHQGIRKVIDVSADSGNYGGLPLHVARDAAIVDDITINGLAVLCRTCDGRPSRGDLESYFAQQVIGGFGAFVVTVDQTTSFPEAVRRKLLLEVAGLPQPPLASR